VSLDIKLLISSAQLANARPDTRMATMMKIALPSLTSINSPREYVFECLG
jgi:hypothetical protein